MLVQRPILNRQTEPRPVRTSSTPRLKDIADKTGFSTNTVSLALRESPRIPVETRDVIRRAAEELNYQPNHVARSLVSRETKTIGLVLTDIMNPTLTADRPAGRAGARRARLRHAVRDLEPFARARSSGWSRCSARAGSTGC